MGYSFGSVPDGGIWKRKSVKVKQHLYFREVVSKGTSKAPPDPRASDSAWTGTLAHGAEPEVLEIADQTLLFKAGTLQCSVNKSSLEREEAKLRS